MKLATELYYHVKNLETGKTFDIVKGAPTEWASERGATYSLLSENGGHRPAILSATRVKVGVDEDENGNIVWENWAIKVLYSDSHLEQFEQVIRHYCKIWKDSGWNHFESLMYWKPLSL